MASVFNESNISAPNLVNANKKKKDSAVILRFNKGLIVKKTVSY